MKGLKIKFKDSIKRKLLVIFILTGFIPLLVLGECSIYYAGKIMNNKTSKLSIEILKQIHSGLNNQFRNLDDLSLKLLASSEIQKYLSDMDGSVNTSEDKGKAQDYIQQILSTNMMISSAEFFGEKGQHLNIGYDFKDEQDYKTSAWYKITKENDGDITFISLNKNSYITVSRLIKNTNNEEIGVLRLALAPQFLSDVYRETNLGKDSRLYIVNKQGNIVVSKDEKEQGKNVSKDVTSEFKKVKTESYTSVKSVNSVEQMLTIISLENLKCDNTWYIVSMIPQKTILEDTKLMQSIVWIAVLACSLFAIILGLIFSKSIITPINKLVKATYEISKGNLSITIDNGGKDEIGKLSQGFGMMVENMKGLIKDIKEMSNTVTSSSNQVMVASNEAKEVSDQIAIAVNDIAKGALDQAEEAQKGNFMLLDVIKGLEDVSKMILESKGISEKASVSVDDGVKTVEYQQDKMRENKNATINVSKAIEELHKKTNEIESIISVINSIAEETNLLALNAAIEAARAGEHGKGFAVVAFEVRKLSEESAASTGKIANLVIEIKSYVENVVNEINRSQAVVEEQEKAVIDTTDKFEAIKNVVFDFVEKLENVFVSIENLNSQASIVGSNINNITNIIEENASAAEQVSASAEEQSAAISQISSSTEELAASSKELESEILKFDV